MEYFTTQQMAKLWNISPTRVTILAKSGRLCGAIRTGAQWLIPQTTEKPVDGRTKRSKNTEPEKPFRFPLFLAKDEKSFSPPLTAEERTLKKTSELFYACEFEQAEKTLSDLPDTATDTYIRIASLHARCMICLALCRHQIFFATYEKLTELLLQDFPHKKEMEFFLHELNATIGFGDFFNEDFEIDPAYSYHESFLPNLATLPTLSLCFSATKRITQRELNAHEINAFYIDGLDSPVDSQSIHLYLGLSYSVIADTSRATLHYQKAFLLAQNNNLFWLPAIEYYYFGATMEEALKTMDSAFIKQFRSISDTLRKRFVQSKGRDPYINFYKLISKNRFIYVLYASKGYSNIEVAHLLRLSENTVAKIYSSIYEMFGIQNKKDLTDYYFQSIKRF